MIIVGSVICICSKTINVVYHISETKVLIDGNMLKLLGDEKRYYHEYFGWNDIIKKTKRH